MTVRITPSDFNAPHGPDGIALPLTAHLWADAVLWVVAGGLALLAVVELVRRRTPLGLVLLAGGAIALFNEPVDDILGLVWHPRPGQNTVIDTIGPVPMWGLPTYIIFFGGVPWLLLRELQKLQFTLRAFWAGIAITFVLDLLIELPLLRAELYTYYPVGDVPMSIAGFPLYWLMINTTGPILCAAILFAAQDYFRGWRAPFLVLVPVVADAACSIAVGLPVYTALHTPGASELVRWAGAVLSCLIGLVILDALSRFILGRTRQLRDSTPPARPALSREFEKT
ncbi:MAG: hypothetical protein QOI68_2055 [Pseudonocardiales bacterium]|nr:hypothetical protein [Pseudonocardiales bacterium]